MIRTISSENNAVFKLCKALSKKKHRDKECKYVIEGNNLINEAFINNANIKCVIVKSDSILSDISGEANDYSKLPSSLNEYNFDNIYVMDDKLFDQISSTENSQGTIAIVDKATVAIDAFENTISSEDNILILDRLQDPGNVGTIIRTADATGYRGIICVKGTVDVYSPKVVRSAVGSIFRIPIIYVQDEQDVVSFVHKINFTLVSTSPNANDNYYEKDLSKAVALVVGNEANGVSKNMLESADYTIKIPMMGNINSLNAAVSAAILMYERIRINKYELNNKEVQ